MNQLRQMNWRTGALVFCVALSLVFSISAYRLAGKQLPAWIEVREGPVAHGIDKFYRNAYFKGNIEVAGDLAVAGDTELGTDLALSGPVTLTTLTVTGTTDLQDTVGNSTGILDIDDMVTITGERDATTGYDYFLYLKGDLDRPAGAETNHGNIDDAGLKVRAETNAVTHTAGYVLRGADIEAKTEDNCDQGTLQGAQVTAVTDSGGRTTTQTALRAHAETEGIITTTLQIADFELNRKNATDPTNEWGLNIRNTSSSGGGADVALRIESSYGAGGAAADDNWDYCIDMEPADAAVADIRLSQGETISNITNGRIELTAITTTLSSNVEITGTLDVGGDIAATNIAASGTITTSSDIEGLGITAIGDIAGSNIVITGDLSAANIQASGTITTSSDIEGLGITAIGDIAGSNIVITGDLSAANIQASGTITTSSDIEVVNIRASGDIQGLTLGISGLITTSDDIEAVNITTSGFVALTAGDVLTATGNGYVITPTASYQPIDADGAYTATVADGSRTGQLLILINRSSNNITLTEAAYNAVTGGDVELTGGAHDSLSLLWDGTNWVRTASAVDN